MTSPTYDVCVGHAFSVDTQGVLQLKIDGSPTELAWPYGGDPAVDNPLRTDPAGGLWLPPVPKAAPVTKSDTGSPNKNLSGSGKTYTTPALQMTVKNPSNSLSVLVWFVAEARWVCDINANTQFNGGIQITQDKGLDPAAYTQADDSGPYDDQVHSWSGGANGYRSVVLAPGGSSTFRMAAQVECRNGSGVFEYYRNQFAGFALAVTTVSASLVVT